MSEMRTLSRGDAGFEAHLRGTFSKTHRALPVQSLNVNSDREVVTFEIKAIKDIQRPSPHEMWLQILRLREFLSVLIPLFLILCKNRIDDSILDPLSASLSALGIVFLFAALRLRNDFSDHMNGWDRIHPHRGSRAIQQGWVAAETLNSASKMFFVLASLCAVPVLFVFPEVLFMLLPAAMLGLTLVNAGQRLPLWARDVIPGLLAGPLLVWGFELTVSGGLTFDGLWLGLLWGWLAMFPFHLQRLEHLVVEAPTGAGGWVTSLGFDRALRFIHWWWIFGLSGFVAYQFFFSGFFWFWFFTLILLFVSLRFSSKLGRLRSPMGSQMADIRKRGQYLYMTLVALWVFETLWQVNF